MDSVTRATEELIARLLNPEATSGLPGTTEEHAAYLLNLMQNEQLPLSIEAQEILRQADQLEIEAAQKEAQKIADQLVNEDRTPDALRVAAETLRQQVFETKTDLKAQSKKTQ